MAEKRFIINEYGETVNVTEEEYNKYIEEHPEAANTIVPKFQTPEQQENRRKIIDNVIEDLNNENLTDNDMYKIEEEVKVDGDIEKENRERLDDDLNNFQTPVQQESIEGKDSKIQNIINMLNQLNLSEQEMMRIESEVQRVNNKEKDDTEEKESKEQKDER